MASLKENSTCSPIPLLSDSDDRSHQSSSPPLVQKFDAPTSASPSPKNAYAQADDVDVSTVPDHGASPVPPSGAMIPPGTETDHIFLRLQPHVPLQTVFAFLEPRDLLPLSLTCTFLLGAAFSTDHWFCYFHKTSMTAVRELEKVLLGLHYPLPMRVLAAGGDTRTHQQVPPLNDNEAHPLYDVDGREPPAPPARENAAGVDANPPFRVIPAVQDEERPTIAIFSRLAEAAVALRAQLEIFTPLLKTVTLSAVCPLPRLTKTLRKLADELASGSALAALTAPACSTSSADRTIGTEEEPPGRREVAAFALGALSWRAATDAARMSRVEMRAGAATDGNRVGHVDVEIDEQESLRKRIDVRKGLTDVAPTDDIRKQGDHDSSTAWPRTNRSSQENSLHFLTEPNVSAEDLLPDRVLKMRRDLAAALVQRTLLRSLKAKLVRATEKAEGARLPAKKPPSPVTLVARRINAQLSQTPVDLPQHHIDGIVARVSGTTHSPARPLPDYTSLLFSFPLRGTCSSREVADGDLSSGGGKVAVGDLVPAACQQEDQDSVRGSSSSALPLAGSTLAPAADQMLSSCSSSKLSHSSTASSTEGKIRELYERRDQMNQQLRFAMVRVCYLRTLTKLLRGMFLEVSGQMSKWTRAAEILKPISRYPAEGVRIVIDELGPPLRLFEASHGMADRASRALGHFHRICNCGAAATAFFEEQELGGRGMCFEEDGVRPVEYGETE